MPGATQLSRRTVLRGLGTAVALPLLDAMAPRLASAAAAAPAKPATRLAWVYVPNGIHMQDWTPKATGADFELPQTLAILKDFRQDLLVLTGLTQNGARPLGDGAGDHARALASYLTGTHPRKTGGADIKCGKSVDQVAAETLGQYTRFPSIELGCEGSQQAGSCDSGYSCAYSSNISWRTESSPVPKEINPRSVFERLFTTGGNDSDQARMRREQRRKSVLDFVKDDAGRLSRDLGSTDRRKLDEYMSSVRELEKRISRFDWSKPATKPSIDRPDGIPKDFAEHVQLMFDLMLVAFQTDSTRVATLVIANEGSNRNYPMIGVNDGHHEMSHHGGDKNKQEKVAKIDRFHMEQFARFLGKLRESKEGDSNLLERSMISYGSCIGDGDRHNHDDLPVIVCGRGSGAVTPGRHLKYPKDTPLNNLWLSMLEKVDVQVDKLGDSSGRISDLKA